MGSIQHSPVKKLIVAMLVIVVTGIGIAYLYYKNENNSVDPRIREARLLYAKYNDFVQTGQYDSIFILMDRIEDIYSKIPHYRNSYETGVLHNNRAATFLSLFLQAPHSFPLADTAMLLNDAGKEAIRSIKIYEDWLKVYKEKPEDEIKQLISEEFLRGLESYDPGQQKKFLDKRVKELVEAQTENQRRLSVSYTNLGIVKRHQQKYDSAAIFYQKAIELWDRNLTAENNLNILLNKPLKKRRAIENLFPPER